MRKERMETFSDGLLAIVITVMVLELAVPRSPDPEALRETLPTFGSYVMSFVYLAIYWNNHHHLMHVVERIDGRVLWANMHLLFWLSLVPFATAWMGDTGFAAWPVALYGTILLLAGVAYFLLVRSLLALHDRGSVLAVALGRDLKGKVSVGVYLAAIPLAFVGPWLACALYVAVAVTWLVPDRRIERALAG